MDPRLPWAEEAGEQDSALEQEKDTTLFQKMEGEHTNDEYNEDDEHGEAADEEDVCRICRTSGDEASPLSYPCACSGSIKFVHQDCLLQWLTHSNTRQCEVCKHPFTFSPVYAENAPVRLPFLEFFVGMTIKAGKIVHFLLRLVFVLSIWLIFVPFMTFWIWRFTFVRSISEGQKVFLDRLTLIFFFTDCLHGFLLSAGIVFILLGVTSLREYFRHLKEIGGHGVGREEDARVRRHGQALLQNIAGQVEGNREGLGLAAGAGQIIRRNAENVAARLEMQAARLEAHVEQMFEGADDPDGAEDFPFDELVGMQGPVFHLIENAITVLASNATFLALVAFVPFTLGRVVLAVASYMWVAVPLATKLIVTHFLDNEHTLPFRNTSGVVDELFLSLENVGLVNKSHGAALLKGNVGRLTLVRSMTIAEKYANALAMSSSFSDAATIGAGYGVILIVVSSYFCIMALMRIGRGEAVVIGRIHGLASLTEAAPSIAKQIMGGLKHMLIMFKVAFLLLIELGIFPLLCGWWIDICSLSLLGGSITNRVSFFVASPFTSSMLHWLFGIVYMLQISMFVSLLREVLRPGLLYFLRDPADPNYNSFQDLVNDPIHKHARRVLLSIVVYGSLVVMLIFLPIKLALLVAPSMFPFAIRISDPFTEIPADMLLFHICIPFAIEHLRPRTTLKAVLLHWLAVVGWGLGLSEFLLSKPSEVDEQGQHAGALGGGNMAVHGENVIENNDVDDLNAPQECKFVVRIILLLLAAWCTLLLCNTAIALIPVAVGRAIFTSISRLPATYGVKCNDLYAFNIGCYIIWAIAAGIGYSIDSIKKHNLKVLALYTLKWAAIVMKCFLLLSLWIIVIPILIGLLFELLVVVPLRVPVDESPVFVLHQDWALGLVFLKIWTRLVMLDQMTPLADETWRLKFEQVKADGFSQVRGMWVLREIVTPVLFNLLTALCFPYVFARGLFPVFGYSTIVNSAVYRFAWAGCLTLGAAWYGTKRLQTWFIDLHNTIRDDRYLLGKKLHNFEENSLSPGNEGSEDSLNVVSLGSKGDSDCTFVEESVNPIG